MVVQLYPVVKVVKPSQGLDNTKHVNPNPEALLHFLRVSYTSFTTIS